MKIYLFLLLFTFSHAYAVNPSQDWILFCGDQATFLDHMGPGIKPSTKDLREVDKSRGPILKVLTEGKKGLAELLKEGNRSDTGPFGAILACGVIEKIKYEIKDKGCYLLLSNKRVSDQGGIKACEEFLSRMPR